MRVCTVHCESLIPIPEAKTKNSQTLQCAKGQKGHCSILCEACSIFVHISLNHFHNSWINLCTVHIAHVERFIHKREMYIQSMPTVSMIVLMNPLSFSCFPSTVCFLRLCGFLVLIGVE